MHLSKPHWDGNYLIINILNPTAGLFAGDHVEVNVTVCPGASAVLTSPSSSRVFRARDSTGKAQVTQVFRVESGARLDIFPEILIAHAGARYRQTTRIDVQSGGELLVTEMIAPGRTAFGESFDYDQLEFSVDLMTANGLAIREWYRLESHSESVRAIRRHFPNAYYASTFVVSNRGADESFPEAISALNTPRVLAGASRPAENIYAIKMIAADSLSLRAAVASIRAMAYSYLEWPEPLLRKL